MIPVAVMPMKNACVRPCHLMQEPVPSKGSCCGDGEILSAVSVHIHCHLELNEQSLKYNSVLSLMFWGSDWDEYQQIHLDYQHRFWGMQKA